MISWSKEKAASRVPLHSVGGTVSGLSGSKLVLMVNLEEKPISANGAFSYFPLAKGDSYSVTIMSQPVSPAQSCVVQNGTGTVGENDVNDVAVKCGPLPQYAYVASAANNTMSSFAIDSTTGQAHYNGYLAPGIGPVSIAVHPSGKYVYVANNGSNNVSVFTINQDTGELRGGTTIAAGQHPQAVVVHPSGRFVYVVNRDTDDVSVFTVNQDTGGLSGNARSMVRGYPDAITMAPSGKFVTVGSLRDPTGYNYIIDQETGMLTNGSSSEIPYALSPPSDHAVDPSGKFTYFANHGNNNISMFAINQETGDLSRVGITGTYGLSVTVHPSGRFAYAANINSNDVSVFTITPGTGTLVAGKSVPAGINPVSVTLDASGKFAYVPNLNSNDISMYTVNQDSGALAAIGTVDSDGVGPVSITIDRAGKYAYVANYGFAASVFSINPDTGMLTADRRGFGALGAYSIVLHPSGFAYVATLRPGGNFIYGSAVKLKPKAGNGDIMITPGFRAASAGPYSIGFDPAGKFAYVADWLNNKITTYTVNSDTGVWTTSAMLSVAANPQSVTIDQTGRFVYVTHQGSDDISRYNINQSTGALTAAGVVR